VFGGGDLGSPSVVFCGPRDGDVAGYAVVDAMTAMLILALTAILSLQALDVTRKAAERTAELRGADALIGALLADGPRRFGAVEGRDAGFGWRLEIQATGADRPIELCRRAVELRSERSGRAYGAVTLETCPPADAP